MWTKATEQELIALFSDLIRLDTTNPGGNETLVADYIAAVLAKDGIESTLLAKEKGRDNLIASIGEGEKTPIILLSHVDVVEAVGEWDFPPFSAHNENGVIYGRGAIDTKHLTAMEIMAMLLLKREGLALNRKIILVASADEENGSAYGMAFLSEEHSELLPRALTVSEGGGFVITEGDQKYRTCTCGEKGDCKLSLTVAPKAEKSEFDVSTQAGYALLKTLVQLGSYQSEQILCGATEGFQAVVDIDHIENPTLKNLWEYSTKNNLVFSKFSFDGAVLQGDVPITVPVSFRFIKGVSQQDICVLMDSLGKGLDNHYTVEGYEDGFETAVDSDFIQLLDKHALLLDEGVIMLPMLALGRTDGRFIKRDVYGFSPMLGDLPFSEVLKMVHQPNERISVASLVYGTRVLYGALRELCVE